MVNFKLRVALLVKNSSVSRAQASYLDKMVREGKNPWYGAGFFVNHLNVDPLSSLTLCGRQANYRFSSNPLNPICKACVKRWENAVTGQEARALIAD